MLISDPEHTRTAVRVGEFADWLRQAISERGLSQNAVAERSGVGKGAISEMLGPTARLPGREVQERLATFLGSDPVDVRALVERDRLAKNADRLVADAEARQLPSLVDQIADRVTERVVERLETLFSPSGGEEVETMLQRAGITDPTTLDDRLPVLFHGVVWDELTDQEKAGVIALAKRLMGRPRGRMGRRVRADQ